PGLIDEIVFIDLLALFLAVATVETIWYVVKKAFPNEVGDVQLFAPFIFVVVPFVMLIYFGLALIDYDAMATRSGWQPVLPLKGLLSPPIVGAVVFYVGRCYGGAGARSECCAATAEARKPVSRDGQVLARPSYSVLF